MEPPIDIPTALASRMSALFDYWIEVQCVCGRYSLVPHRLVVRQRGDLVLSAFLGRLRCQTWGGRVAEAWVSESAFRRPIAGAPPARWSVQVWPVFDSPNGLP